MAEVNINKEIENLKSLATGGGIDSSNTEFGNRSELDEAISILEIIKSGKPSKEQLETIIKFLESQSSSDIITIARLNSYKSDFKELLKNYDKDKTTIVKEAKDSTKKINSLSDAEIQNKIQDLKDIALGGLEDDDEEKADKILSILSEQNLKKEDIDKIKYFLDYNLTPLLFRYKSIFKEKADNTNLDLGESKKIIAKNSKGQIAEVLGAVELNNYNKLRLKRYNKRIIDVISKLDENDEEQKKLKEELEKLLKNPENSQVEIVQNIIKALGGKISKSGNADGFFGGLTMSSLEKIAKIEPKKVIKKDKIVDVSKKDKTQTSNKTTTGAAESKTPANAKPEVKQNTIKLEKHNNIKVPSDGSIMSGEFTRDGKTIYLYNGTRKFTDGRVDIYEKGEKKDYTVEYMALMSVMVANDIASFTGVWTIPGLAIGAGYDLYDLSQKEDAGWQALKKMGLVDNRYYAGDKGILQYSMNVLGLIPGMTAALKRTKIAKFASTLSDAEKVKFDKLQSFMQDKFFGIGETAAKKGQIGQEYSKEANDLRKALEKAAKEKKKTKKTNEAKVKAKKTTTESTKTHEKTYNFGETKKVLLEESEKLGKSRASSIDGLPTGEYAIYASRYEKLYKDLDTKGITDLAKRGEEIAKLDRSIAKEILRTKVPENISDEIYETFVKTGKVGDDVLNSIAKKITEGKKISDRELAIQKTFNKEIENILSKAKKSADEGIKTGEKTTKAKSTVSEETIDNSVKSSNFAKTKEVLGSSFAKTKEVVGSSAEKLAKIFENSKEPAKNIISKMNSSKDTGLKALSWVKDKTIGDIWKEIQSGYAKGGFKRAGDITRTILLSGKSGEWNLKGVAGKATLAGGLSYVDNDFEIPQDGSDFIQNYYEILLFNWLGIMAFESDNVAMGLSEGGAFLYNALNKSDYKAEEILIPGLLKSYSNWVKENIREKTPAKEKEEVSKNIPTSTETEQIPTVVDEAPVIIQEENNSTSNEIIETNEGNQTSSEENNVTSDTIVQ